jgi:hypothetical protein
MYARIEQTAAQADLADINPRFGHQIPLLQDRNEMGQRRNRSRSRFDNPMGPRSGNANMQQFPVIGRGRTSRGFSRAETQNTAIDPEEFGSHRSPHPRPPPSQRPSNVEVDAAMDGSGEGRAPKQPLSQLDGEERTSRFVQDLTVDDSSGLNESNDSERLVPGLRGGGGLPAAPNRVKAKAKLKDKGKVNTVTDIVDTGEQHPDDPSKVREAGSSKPSTKGPAPAPIPATAPLKFNPDLIKPVERSETMDSTKSNYRRPYIVCHLTFVILSSLLIDTD